MKKIGTMNGIGLNSRVGLGGTATVIDSGRKNLIGFNDVKLTGPDKSLGSVAVSGKIPF